jgi:hypothetical protein
MANPKIAREGTARLVQIIGKGDDGLDYPIDLIQDDDGRWRVPVDAAVSVAGLDSHLERNIQVFNDDLVPLAAKAIGNYDLASHDCRYYADFAPSVYLERDGANDSTVDVVIQTSRDNATWREVDRQQYTIDASNTSDNFNRNYNTMRRYMRVRLEVVGGSVKAEVTSNLKPIG